MRQSFQYSAAIAPLLGAEPDDFLVKHGPQTCLIRRAQPQKNGGHHGGSNDYMRGSSKGGRTIKLNPVDEAQVTDHPDRHRMVALEDRNLFNQRIKSERSSAYWFAASLWGVTGLVMGAILGVYITLAVQKGSADVWRDNFIAGAAADAARETVDGRPSLVDPNRDRPQEQQP